MEHTQTDHKKAIVIAAAAAFAFASIAMGASQSGGMTGYLTPEEVDFIDIPDYLSTDQIDALGNPTVSHVDQVEKTYPVKDVYFCKDPNMQPLLFEPPIAQDQYDDSYHGSPEQWYEYELPPFMDNDLDAGLDNSDIVFNSIIDKTNLEIASLEDVLYIDEDSQALHDAAADEFSNEYATDVEDFLPFEEGELDDVLFSELESDLDDSIFEDLDPETMAAIQEVEQSYTEHAAAPVMVEKSLLVSIVDEIARWFGVAR